MNSVPWRFATQKKRFLNDVFFLIIQRRRQYRDYIYIYIKRRMIFATCFELVSCLAYTSTLKMEATCFSETSVAFQRTTRRYILKNVTVHTKRR
jgi:hypothetical protein